MEKNQLEATKEFKYESYIPQEDGSLAFTIQEDDIWHRLYEQQIEVIKGRACREYIQGLEDLNLSNQRVPYPVEVTKTLKKYTGWIAKPVPAVIGPREFFTILSEKQFPCACFIRREEDFYYIKEPDIFHEVFGHMPLLTNKHYADFVQEYGRFALTCDKSEWKYLFRLFWFTVEFGLIKTSEGDRIYGGGILSSIGETKTALKNPNVEYIDFDILTCFRTPYRIDIPQTLYFKIESFEQLYKSLQVDLKQLIVQAKELGDITPKFTPVDGKGDELEYTN